MRRKMLSMNKIKVFTAISAIFSCSFDLRAPNNDAPFSVNNQQIHRVPLQRAAEPTVCLASSLPHEKKY